MTRSRWAGLWFAGVLLFAACSSNDEASESSERPAPTVVDTTTTEQQTRAEIGAAIGEAADPTRQLDYLHSDPERIAEMAAEYCADLEQSGPTEAMVNLEASMSSFLRVNGGPGNRDSRMADVSASLVGDNVADAASEILCPDVGASKYLPAE